MELAWWRPNQRHVGGLAEGAAKKKRQTSGIEMLKKLHCALRARNVHLKEEADITRPINSSLAQITSRPEKNLGDPLTQIQVFILEQEPPG